MSRSPRTDIRSGPTPEMEQAVQAAQQEGLRPPVLASDKSVGAKWQPLVEDYYGPMRLFGYVFSALAGKMEGWIKNGAANHFDTEITDQQAKRYVGFTEFAFFGGLTAAYYVKEKNELYQQLMPSVSAEKKCALGAADLGESNNPIIQTARERLRDKVLIRGASDMAFIRSVLTGVVAQAVRITVERTVFAKPTAYQKLEKLFEDTQLYNFNIHAKHKVIRELANVIQQSQLDHGRKGWESEVMDQFEPFFDKIADQVIDKKMGIAEITYMLGEVMVRRHTADEALELFENVRDHGLLAHSQSRLPEPKNQLANFASKIPEKKTESVQKMLRPTEPRGFRDFAAQSNVVHLR